MAVYCVSGYDLESPFFINISVNAISGNKNCIHGYSTQRNEFSMPNPPHMQSLPDRNMKFILVYQGHLTNLSFSDLYIVNELIKLYTILCIFFTIVRALKITELSAFTNKAW